METTLTKIETTAKDDRISSAVNAYSSEEVAIMKATVAKGTSDMEFVYFLMLAKSLNLNPFNKEIWCYKDGKGNLLTFAGRDGFLKAAQSNDKFGGLRSAYVCMNDEFEMDIPNNQIHHKIKNAERGDILGAYAIAFRKQEEPTIVWVDFKTFNKGFNAWKTHPGEMIVKVAESQALKKAFGLSGLDSAESFTEKQTPATNTINIEDFDDSGLDTELKINQAAAGGLITKERAKALKTQLKGELV